MASDGKLSASRSSIDSFISTLGDKDLFDLITFNRQAEPLFNSLTMASDETGVCRPSHFSLLRKPKEGPSCSRP